MAHLQDAVEEIMRAANGSCTDLEYALHQAIINEHRFTQGQVIAMLARVLVKVGKVNHGTDVRNEDAIEACRALGRVGQAEYKEDITRADFNMLRRFLWTR